MTEGDRNQTQTTATGVIGVGAMGQHHARVYSELPTVELVGVTDTDSARADEVAARYGTVSMNREDLLDAVDAVTLAVPTAAHYHLALECIERGVHVLVEKPFVKDAADGYDLVAKARAADVALQVGHIERFNPAIDVLDEIIPSFEVIAVNVDRLGPPPAREISDNVVRDLMVHDIDVLLTVLNSDVADVAAVGTADGRFATAQLTFDSGLLASVTASRVTQRKVRRLRVTASEAWIDVDYANQDVEIHRHSVPEYIEVDGALRDRQLSVIERPIVANGEPLRYELKAFVSTVRQGGEPVVGGIDGIRVIKVTEAIERALRTPISPIEVEV